MMKKLKPATVSAAALQALIDFCEKNWGGKLGGQARVIARYRELTGAAPSRRSFGYWLHPDPAKRLMPSHGVGLILTRIGDELIAKQRGVRRGNL